MQVFFCIFLKFFCRFSAVQSGFSAFHKILCSAFFLLHNRFENREKIFKNIFYMALFRKKSGVFTLLFPIIYPIIYNSAQIPAVRTNSGDRIYQEDYSAVLSVARNRCASAARTPPTIGASKNTHTHANASPPVKSAGPKLRAGFTEVPVK